MDQAIGSAGTQSRLWRRIVNFPLAAMVIAVALFILATSVAMRIGNLLLPLPPLEKLASNAILGIGLVFAVYKLVIVRLGDRPRDDLRAAGALKGTAAGLILGFLLFSTVVGIAALFGVYSITGSGDTRELAKDLIGTAILAAFMEELLFRGILFRWIEEFAGSWAALVVTSALFGLAHIVNPNATWFSSFAIAVEAGLLLGGAYMLTRNLWMPMGLHAAWNFTQGFIFDVPVSGSAQNGLVAAKLSGPTLLSGGGFGLEASVIALVIATAAGLWLVWRAVSLGELVQPWWVRRRVMGPTLQ
jgi:membrane protease YdiL (CAAX protease family)